MRRGHEGLLVLADAVEKRGGALRIEFREHVVEQQQRRFAGRGRA